MICGAPSFSSHDGVEQWYQCQLSRGHNHDILNPDNGQMMTERTRHEYAPVNAKPEGADTWTP